MGVPPRPAPHFLQSLPHDNKSNDPPKSTAPPKGCFSTLQEAVIPNGSCSVTKFIKIQIERNIKITAQKAKRRYK